MSDVPGATNGSTSSSGSIGMSITVAVAHLDEHKAVYRELILFKIRVSSAQDSMRINEMANAYGGKVHDVRRESMMVELTATPDQIRAFEELARPFGIIETARTGIAALQRSGSE